MGFIENLRRQKEAREGEAQRQAQIVKSRFEQELELKRHQPEVSHRNQRMKAEQTLKESGIDSLLTELGNLVGGGGVFLYGKSRELEERRIPIRDVDSYFEIFTWEYKKSEVGWNGYHNCSEKYFVIEACPDGVVKIDSGSSGGSVINSNQWRSNSSLLEGALERAFNNSRVRKWREKETPAASSYQGDEGPCLPGNSSISTPNGFILIKDLRVGDYVWTVDRFGRRVKTVTVKKAKKIVSKNHKVTHIVLKDGRELFVSLGHPTIDYKQIGSLVRGDDLDMSCVASIKVIPYKGKYTYDILPYGETGGYWANSILIGSTLSDQFQNLNPSYFNSIS